MNTYTITWPDGTTETGPTEHTTIEHYANERFGSAYEEFVTSGGNLDVHGTEESSPAP
jgi:hypothetical protein